MIFLHILFLPFFLLVDTVRSTMPVLKKIGYFLVFLVIFGLSWLGGYARAAEIAKMVLFNAGIYDRLTKVKVSGDSMLPLILPMESGGKEITLHSPKKYGLERGDIVSFMNQETAKRHYLKRIVGLPGEKVTLKNGYVFINDQALMEEYTLDELPTYGQTFLNDCYPRTIPEKQYMVLGDNRTVSMDSRVIGFVEGKDIDGVIKSKKSYEYWPDNVQAKILKNNIDINTLVAKINDYRTENKTEKLMVSNELNGAAKSRAKSIVENFTTWKKSAETLSTIFEKSGYKNNSYYEYVTFGYLDEDRIVKQIMESVVDKTAFLSGNYYEIGAAAEINSVGDCSFPVISIVIAWPNKPTFTPEVINLWKTEELKLKEALTAMKNALNVPGVDRTATNEIIKKLTEIIDVVAAINKQITNNEWIDAKLMEQYEKLADEVEEKVNKMINSDASRYSAPVRPQPTAVKTQVPAANNRLTAQQVRVEKDVMATINTASETSTKINVKITFANVGSGRVNFYPIRTTMRNGRYGTAGVNVPASMPLDPGSLRQFDYSFEKLTGGGPYDFFYLSSTGESIKLGSYN